MGTSIEGKGIPNAAFVLDDEDLPDRRSTVVQQQQPKSIVGNIEQEVDQLDEVRLNYFSLFLN